MDIMNAGAGGAGGVIGAVLGFFGLRYRLSRIEKAIDEKRTITTCEAMYKTTMTRFDGLEGMQKEMRKDIKEILNRLPPNKK